MPFMRTDPPQDQTGTELHIYTKYIIAQKSQLVKHFQKILIVFLLFVNKSEKFAA